MPQKTLRQAQPGNINRGKRMAPPRTAAGVAAFVTEDGCVFEVADAGSDLGRVTVLASERSLSRLWRAVEEDQACRIFREET